MSLFKVAIVAAVPYFSIVCAASLDNHKAQTINLKPQYLNGTVSVEHASVPGNLDGFKMETPAARSTADFWYFDVLSESTNQTLNIVFFNSGEFASYPHPLAVQVSGTFSNGTGFYYEALADDGVTVSNGRTTGVRGNWKGIGSFTGSSLDNPNVQYKIKLDSPEMGIKGSIEFNSIAPPRYPCDLNGVAGANQVLVPGLYWANAVPDAETTVDLKVGDTRIRFNDGIGYHDKNWGNQSIVDGPRYWDWGHGRFGPYSVVWYNLLDYEGKESRRSFVYKEGEVLLLSCSNDSLEVRQRGGKAAWPPTTGLLETDGIIITYTLPNNEKLMIEAATDIIVRDESGAYQRANANLRGGIVGGETYEGRAHMEEFIFGIVNDYMPKNSEV
ncbi:hypothetical protein ACHAPT_001222 [Fusarium lateritium]